MLGFIHRDVSTGNILVYQVNGKIYVKISNLECMRKMSDLTITGDVKTVCGVVTMKTSS